MLLEDFKSTTDRKLKKINETLKSQFGFSLTMSASQSDLTKLKEAANKNIYLLKLNGSTVNTCEDLSKHVLIAEGIELIIEKKRLDELRKDFLTSNPYRRVINQLSDFVTNNVTVGDDFDDALAQAMKEYRSSIYRFPDMYVEHDVRKAALTKIEKSNALEQSLDNSMDSQNQIKVTEMKQNYVKKLRQLLESEVTDAEIIIATKGFSKSLQEMIEKIGRLQNEDLPPLTDQMREEHGVDTSSQFMIQTQAALQGVMDSLYAAKNEVDLAVNKMAAADAGMTDMDADLGLEPELSADPDLDAELGMEPEMGISATGGDEGLEAGGDLDAIADEFGGDAAVAGDDEPLGRMQKESRAKIGKQILEMQKSLQSLKAMRKQK